MAETYRLTLRASGPYFGCESSEELNLAEYGYTDEGWDALTDRERNSLLEEWGEEFFWNEGYEYNAEVTSG